MASLVLSLCVAATPEKSDSHGMNPPCRQFRMPRITLGMIMITIIPFAAYLALYTEIAKRPEVERPIIVGLELVLLALSGFAIAAYRQTTFLGWVVQMTTTPCLLLSWIWVVVAN